MINILNRYIKGNIDKIKITRTSDDISKIITNKDDIAKVIQDLSKIKMTKFNKDRTTTAKDVYYIVIYVEGNQYMGMSIYDEDYVTWIIDLGNYTKQGHHKILKNSFSIKYIESLF